MITPAIEAVNLTKVYQLKGNRKEIRALDNLNLSIKKGELFGLLGPNGAGKTTFVRILTTSLAPTSGDVYIDGFNINTQIKQAKSRISIMLGGSMNYGSLSGYNNLKFYAKIYKIKNYRQKIEELAEKIGLNEWLNQYVYKYSSGMLVKLAVCRTLLIDRPFLFLDEPMRGLDVKTKDFLINILKNSGKTILLTSHDMDVIEKVCNKIAFIKNGTIIKFGTPEDIKIFKHSEIQIEAVVEKNIEQLLLELKDLDYVKNFEHNLKSIKITIENRNYYNDIISTLTKYKISIFNEKVATLEESFRKIVS